jgi:hypothetical protein
LNRRALSSSVIIADRVSRQTDRCRRSPF